MWIKMPRLQQKINQSAFLLAMRSSYVTLPLTNTRIPSASALQPLAIFSSSASDTFRYMEKRGLEPSILSKSRSCEAYFRIDRPSIVCTQYKGEERAEWGKHTWVDLLG
jgi:hypothetical protein